MKIMLCLILGIVACVHYPPRDPYEGMTKAERIEAACSDSVATQYYPTKKYCKTELRHPGFDNCVRESPNGPLPADWEKRAAKCAWAINNPVEARCETETSSRDEYWQCVRVRQEHEDRVSERRQVPIVIENSGPSAGQVLGEGLRRVGEGMKSRPKTRCVTNTQLGQVVTECQ